MTSTSIQNKIKAGLAKAIAKTGSSSSDLIFKVTQTNAGGDSPIDLPVNTEVTTELVDAIFQSYKSKEFNDSIRAGDKKLVSNSDVEITEGDTIRQGSTDFAVIAVDTKAPTSDVLAYISQVREM